MVEKGGDRSEQSVEKQKIKKKIQRRDHTTKKNKVKHIHIDREGKKNHCNETT